MNLFRRMIGNKTPEDMEEPDLEEEIRALAKSEDAVARADANSGLVALYPELGASRRRRRRGFADLDDLDDYVPELDDYEPGLEGEYLQCEDEPPTPSPSRRSSVAKQAPAPAQDRYAQIHDLDEEDEDDEDLPEARTPNYRLEHSTRTERARPESLERPAAPVQPEAVDDPEEEDVSPGLVKVPVPAAGRAGNHRAGRVKTRLLGFGQSTGETDPFEAAKASATAVVDRFPVGWIVVMEGPGRGASFTLFDGVSAIGRGDDQAVRLDFGDNSISRSNHAMVAYDSEQKKFYLGHGGKANLVRLNGKPVLSTEELSHDDKVRIGETTLRFIALCGPDFDWTTQEGATEVDAASA